jgi:hypothetical protein
MQMMRKRQSHWRIQPQDVFGNADVGNRIGDEPAKQRTVRLRLEARRHPWHRHVHARRVAAYVDARIAARIDPDRFFDVQDATIFCRTAEQMLRPLEDKVPP